METRRRRSGITNYTSFEPTYEGWKHLSLVNQAAKEASFEPTYEGWKRPYTYICLPRCHPF